MTRTQHTSRTRLIHAALRGATLLLGALALLPGCSDDAPDDDPDIALREGEEKTETEFPPPPPPPPGPEADADQDLLGKAEPKQPKDTGPDTVKGRYIVQLKQDADPHAAAAAVGAKPDHVYSKTFRGFAGALSPGQLKALEKRADVERIEPDQIVTADYVQPMDGVGQPWGLDRIDQRDLPLDQQYIYFRKATGVRAYVLDTGIESDHKDFPYAMAVYDVYGGNGQDCNGHGTHVAGTIGGNFHGVAKETYLRGVRVLDCNGKGTISGIMAGVEWVANNHIKPAVANMSLITGKSWIFNQSVNRLADAGVFVAVAAGNGNADACNYSPASASKVFTTAASDQYDVRASFSNFGPCVDAYAPGVKVRSAWLGDTSISGSGTSMATPHVAGVAALYKSVYGDASSSIIEKEILKRATPGKIKNNPTGTANLLLFQWM